MRTKRWLPLALLALFSGCNETEQINNIAIWVAILFVIAWTLSTLVPRLAKTDLFRATISWVRKPLFWFSWLIQIFGAGLSFVSLGNPDTFILVLVGGVTIVAGHYLRKAVALDDTESRPIGVKMIAVCISFIIAFLWLMFSAADTLRLNWW